MIHLCATLGSNSKQSWLEACQNLVSDEEFVSDIDFCMKKDCHSEEIGKLLNFLAEGKQMSIFTESLAKSKQRVEDTIYDQTSGPMTSHFQIMKQNQFMVDSASHSSITAPNRYQNRRSYGKCY